MVSDELRRPADNFIELGDLREYIQRERDDRDTWAVEGSLSTFCRMLEVAEKEAPTNLFRKCQGSLS